MEWSTQRMKYYTDIEELIANLGVNLVSGNIYSLFFSFNHFINMPKLISTIFKFRTISYL